MDRSRRGVPAATIPLTELDTAVIARCGRAEQCKHLWSATHSSAAVRALTPVTQGDGRQHAVANQGRSG